MNFIQLIPLNSFRRGAVAVASVEFPIPLTPFWIDASEAVDSRSRSFKSIGHGQYKTTRNYNEDHILDNEPICGFASYRIFTSVDSSVDEDGQPVEQPWTGTETMSYVFDQENNQVRVETLTDGRPTIGGTHTRTATTAHQGDLFDEDNPVERIDITLSDPEDKELLYTELRQWMNESDEFRDATNNIGYVPQSTLSESDEGLAEVAGGDFIAFPYTFNSTPPNGMTGDLAALWNGNFTIDASLVTRKNAPVLYREQSKSGEYMIDAARLTSGWYIYENGYSEVELSEPLTSFRDDYGVFEMEDGLNDAPLEARSGLGLGYIAYMFNPRFTGNTNDVFFVSRDGKQYRITLAYGRTNYNYDEETEESTEVFEIISTEVIVTSETTLKTPAITMALPEGAYEVTVTRIERKVESDWVIVADAAGVVDPRTRIGSSVRNTGALLFLVTRSRNGTRWGWGPFDYTYEPRYRVKSSRLHLTPSIIELAEGNCGGDVTGSYDAEWVEEYDQLSGLIKPRNVTEWSAVINGVNWTPEEERFYVGGYMGGSNLVTSTATYQRWEKYPSESLGRFFVAFDEPDSGGKIISTTSVSASVSFNGGVNVSETIDILPPASGKSVFFEGFRLRPR